MGKNGLMFGSGAKELTSKFKVQDGHLIYKRRIKLKKVPVDYDISQIPYMFVLYGTGGRYSPYTVEGPYAVKVPFVVICKTVRFWLLDTFDCSGSIIDSHYKDEWLGVFLYRDIFATLLENGFQGEIYVWKDLYKDLHDDFVDFAWRGLLDLKKVHSIGDGPNKI